MARTSMNASLGITPGSGMQRHHIVPFENYSHPVIIEIWLETGFDINSGDMNGVALPERKDIPGAGNKAIHRGDHPKYRAMMRAFLDQLHKQGGTPQQKRQAVDAKINELRNKLNNGELTLE
jgi:A nuclease family of the HNH/ENDO VII superfamily with conserved AHH